MFFLNPFLPAFSSAISFDSSAKIEQVIVLSHSITFRAVVVTEPQVNSAVTVSGVLESSDVLDNAIHQVFIYKTAAAPKQATRMLLNYFTSFLFNFCK